MVLFTNGQVRCLGLVHAGACEVGLTFLILLFFYDRGFERIWEYKLPETFLIVLSLTSTIAWSDGVKVGARKVRKIFMPIFSYTPMFYRLCADK